MGIKWPLVMAVAGTWGSLRSSETLGSRMRAGPFDKVNETVSRRIERK